MSSSTKFYLKEITEDHIENMLEIHDKNGGNAINTSLLKLFTIMNDESNKYEISVKVAALNTLYSTAIQNINPVVDVIVENRLNPSLEVTREQYVALVDKIARVKWNNNDTGQSFERHNLSFASKYVHFLSQYNVPIYDSYIWIVMIGYLKQTKNDTYTFKSPENYAEFYSVFCEFQEIFSLQKRDLYDVDKFLWQYGKNLIEKILFEYSDQNFTLEKAKSILKKQL